MGTEMNQNDLLAKLLEENKKEVYYSRILGFSAIGILIAVVISLVVTVPKVLHTVDNANQVLSEVSATLETAEEAIGNITEMSDAVKNMSSNMNSFVEDNANQVSDVMTSIDNINFEDLNKAIKNLSDVVEPLAKFFNVFK